MDVTAWLRGLGLEQYAEAFRANDIDADVLAELTAEDLKDLGVTSVGHRRRLLAAIATLGSEATHAGNAALPEHRRPPSAMPHDAERRHLTVMFVDLVDSTALSARLDPEEMREVIRAYQETVAGAVTRFDGFVAKYMGDGVLAYFGYPQAHENDAERAVRAGLALVDEVARQSRVDVAEPLRVRIGIATGLVVVGDLIGSGSAQEQSVVGETPNLAARLQAIAPPGAVLIAPSTRRLIGGEFEFEDLGAQSLKGFPEQVRAWRVLAERAVESRFEARAAGPLTPLVGREQEVALLLDLWHRVRDGEGQAVLLSGEPGIGKSRIIRVLYERLEGEPYIRLRHQCSPQYTHSALRPTIEHLERAAGFGRDDEPAIKLEKLVALLAQASTDHAAEATALIANLLSVPVEGRLPPLNYSPEKQKERTFEVLVEQVCGLARNLPVLVVFEDVHWADPTTVELLDRIIGRIAAVRVFLVLTFRPELASPWQCHPNVKLISLNRLARRQSAALIERVTGGKALPVNVLDQIVAKTDGVPLFIEELTKAVLEAGLLKEEASCFVMTGPLPPLAVPATLQDPLVARLDRLAPMKEVAQIGATIGREFDFELLSVVSRLPEQKLRAALGELVSAELVFQKGSPPEAVYTFKHALVQDAAYEGLLKSRRQQLHARIAQALEQSRPETGESRPELLAHHYAAAGLAREAASYYLRAGLQALSRHALAEATEQLSRGLALVTGLPASRERDDQELDIRVALGTACMGYFGWYHPRVEETLLPALPLCEALGDTKRLLPALWLLFVCSMTRGHYTKASGYVDELLRVGNEADDVDLVLVGHYAGGVVSHLVGEPLEAEKHAERLYALYQPERHRALVSVLHYDVKSQMLFWQSQWLWALGWPDRGVAALEEHLSHARDINYPQDRSLGLIDGSLIFHLRGEPERQLALVEEGAKLAAEFGIGFLVDAEAPQFRAYGLAQIGCSAEAVRHLRSALAYWKSVQLECTLPLGKGILATALADCGDLDGALATINEALRDVERTGERQTEPELWRIKGDLLSRQESRDETEIEACYTTALTVARRQHAKGWELRTANSLARLWHYQGKRMEAHDLLAPIYGWFTEGFDTLDLREAKTLLEDLN